MFSITFFLLFFLSVQLQVAGNFHFAPGKSYAQGNMHIHDFALERANEISISHSIKQLRFAHLSSRTLQLHSTLGRLRSFGDTFPGMVNALDETQKLFPEVLCLCR